MKKSDIVKLQDTQIGILRKIDQICRENRFIYYIIGGTLLGAVRHGGFIPWDPDIDIAMPREDYDKIIEYFDSHDTDLFCQSIKSEPNHGSPHIIIKQKGTHIIYKKPKTKYKVKYDGVYLDIFPLDKAPMNTNLQKKHAKKILFLKRLIFSKVGTIYAESPVAVKIEKQIMHLLMMPFSFKYLQNKLDKEMRKYNGEESQYLVSMASHYSYEKQLMQSHIYGIPKKIKFEKFEFMCPENPHEYLKQLYGDYMKLPPKEQRYQSINEIQKINYE